ncbi:HAD family phosphatase [Mucilaginibacter sp. HMF5004]|uniref:HAD family hydrolase n=1 Tax=Mucilaginibacter rivuli TaxID=2857527 RepID=UPI001C5D6B45|nr:HAD family phosphatase [Mucilaginibacter rivuli]MBW4889903.1 HAD family phosphatase [Mucilaginibacter rivuli]
MKIKAVIFDMDGVLIDARDWHYESLNAALGLFGHEISRYDHLITFDGLPTKKKLEMLSLEGGFPKKLHGFVNELKQQYTIETVFTKCKPIFHHQFALAKLKAEGYHMAVCSNSVRRSIEIMMEKSGLLQYLDFFISNEDVTHSKPHPEMYTTAIERMGLSPLDCLIVEDNENGVKAAVAAGAHVLKVENPDDVHYYNIMDRIKQIEHA